MKFNEKGLWGKGNAFLGFGPDRIRTMVFMATDSSHRAIMGITVLPLYLGCFHPILFILAGTDDMHESSGEFEIRRDLTTDSCPLASEKIPIVL